MKKFRLLIFIRRPESDYEGPRIKNPKTLSRFRFNCVHVFDERDLRNSQSQELYARGWLSENMPGYKDRYMVLEASAGPGKRNKKAYHPMNAKGPRVICDGRMDDQKNEEEDLGSYSY